MTWDFSTDQEFEEQLEWMRTFVREEILPMETLGLDYRTYRRLAEPLKQKVKDAGMFAAHLGPDLGGQGFGQVKLALMHEIMGQTEFAPLVFGANAPDSGNSELIAIGGTEEQKERWMRPLLRGEIYSSFSMTEPGTGSDPKQFTSRAVREGDEWVINGHKWFVGNASRSDVHIVMVVTDPDVHPYEGMSMLLVPTDTPGIEMRELGMMSDPDASGPIYTHCEVFYNDVRVPAENLLGGEGDAFRLAQKRLGPGRMHHAMRWLGVSRRAFDMLCERAVSMSVHGGPLSEKQMVQQWVAELAAKLEATRLLTLQTAWKLDRFGSQGARVDIAMIKYHGAVVMHEVLDKAIQIHGSLGFSTDMPLEEMYRWSRAARFYDGPDEVHKVTVAKQILRRYEPVETPTEHIPTRRKAAQEAFAHLLGDMTANA